MTTKTTKHTPKPWEAIDGIISKVGDKDRVHGEADISMFGDTPEEAQANACLMVASPEMYDALKVLTLDPRILAWLEENDPSALIQARIAISKAEGSK